MISRHEIKNLSNNKLARLQGLITDVGLRENKIKKMVFVLVVFL